MNFKRWLFVSTIIFSLGLVLGLSTPSTVLDDILRDFTGFLEPLPQSAVFTAILFQNISAIMISFTLSPFFLLTPILALTVNGWLIGLVSTMVVEERSLGFLLAGLLPHGVFELPALIMGEAVAFSFGTAVVLAFFKKDGRRLLLSNLRQNLKYLAIALALFVPAAIIETYLTPLLLR